MADEVDNIKREIVTLPTEDKMSIARDVVRGLDPYDRDEFVTEFREASTGALQYRQRVLLIGVGTFIIIVCLVVLMFTLSTAPESVDKVIGVITTLTGTAAGYIGGRATAGQRPEDGDV